MELNAQVLVPGKQNYSLAITWTLDYDPVKVVADTLKGNEPEEEPGEAPPAQNGSHDLPTEGGAAMLARRSLKIQKSRSLEDAAGVSVVHPACISASQDRHRCPADLLLCWGRAAIL